MIPGDVVEAVVTQVEPYGLYLDHDGVTVVLDDPPTDGGAR